MVKLEQMLDLKQCPLCNVDTPSLSEQWFTQTFDFSGLFKRYWRIYLCRRCGGLITAYSMAERGLVQEYFPQIKSVPEELPQKAGAFLQQANDSKHAPSGAIMLAASAVDAMLKEKGYKEGSLYSRIDKAKVEHLITPDMAAWAHEVRLDANGERHADEDTSRPTHSDAQKCIDFS